MPEEINPSKSPQIPEILNLIQQSGGNEAPPKKRSFARRRHSRTTATITPAEATSTPAEATSTPAEVKRVPLEWSDRDEGLLKKLRKPWRQSIPNKPFEPWEREDIGDRLQKLTKQITAMREELDLNTEQLEAVTTTLREIDKESGQIGRKDWVMLGITSLVTLGLSSLVPSATVMLVTKMFLHAVAHFFGEAAAG